MIKIYLLASQNKFDYKIKPFTTHYNKSNKIQYSIYMYTKYLTIKSPAKITKEPTNLIQSARIATPEQITHKCIIW